MLKVILQLAKVAIWTMHLSNHLNHLKDLLFEKLLYLISDWFQTFNFKNLKPQKSLLHKLLSLTWFQFYLLMPVLIYGSNWLIKFLSFLFNFATIIFTLLTYQILFIYQKGDLMKWLISLFVFFFFSSQLNRMEIKVIFRKNSKIRVNLNANWACQKKDTFSFYYLMMMKVKYVSFIFSFVTFIFQAVRFSHLPKYSYFMINSNSKVLWMFHVFH